MKIIKCEKIRLSLDEARTLAKTERILETIYRESEDPSTKKLICKFQCLFEDLWKKANYTYGEEQ